MPVRALVLSALLCLVGCTARPLAVSPRALVPHARALTIAGTAAVKVPGEAAPVRVDADTEVDVAVPDGPGHLERRVTVGELVAGCDRVVPDGAADPCLATRVLDREVVVAHKRERHTGRIATGIVTSAFVLGVGGLCIAECDRGKLALGVGGVIVAGLLLGILGGH
ncbi:MAG: hypothetical protein KBG48_24815 [Kofleriaceae bacterium]|nr:hypothetical protein [Kofleriaceae bacterium]MBP9170649.1 hypothetical protein [Kofleriaceae bacterium]MBP9860931.1 hypothetical protein [Kofleriaceae bacterium]